MSIDRAGAERALAGHLSALGLKSRPVAWEADAERGWWRAQAGQEDPAWRARECEAWKRVGWRGDPLPLTWTALEIPCRVDRRFIRAWHEAWTDPDRLLISLVAGLTDNPWLGPVKLPRSAGICAALSSGQGQGRAAWELLGDARRAGLWIFWVLEDSVVAVALPVIRMEGENLHSGSGPAVDWPDGTPWWIWRGVRVPQVVVEDPGQITLLRVLGEPNAEVRRVMLERFGRARLVEELGQHPIQMDDLGSLYRVFLPDGEVVALVRVANSTPEPDGTRKPYFLRVPPGLKTAREAVAWTFGLPADEYRPSIQT